MIKIKSINEEKFKKMTEYTFNQKTIESTVHPFTENNTKKVFKLFKEKINSDNKFKKIILLEDRLKKIDFVIKAESIIKYKGNIIGYTMPYIEGEIFNCLSFNKKDNILILKDISKKIKKLHSLGIVCGDIIGNIIVDKNKNVYFIDHDNFAIDNLPIDTKNLILQDYERITKSFDYRYDNYELNLFTLNILTRISLQYLKLQYKTTPKYFNFKNEEIRQITEKTLKLKESYNEELIVDKIHSKKDLKKIKRKIF